MLDGIAKFIRKLGPDPTAAWPEPAPGHAVIDTTAQTVCGVPLPCDPDRLRAIGRPSNRHALVDGAVRYYGLGVTFWLDREGRVCDAGVSLAAEDGDDAPPARRCDVVGPHGRCELAPGARVDELAAAFGASTADRRDDGSTRTFRLGPCDLAVEYAADGTVNHLNYFVV